MKFLLAILVVLLLVGGVAAFVVETGRVPIAATAPPDVVDRFALAAKPKAVARGAAGLQVKVPADAASLARGRDHYVEHCLPCHGAPGVKPAEFAEGMNPKPPDVDGTLVQHYDDAQLFWVVKNGIRATGMPAFAANHKDDEIAAIVAFVRHTPHLSAEERKELAEAAPHEDHHHEGEGAAPHEHGEGEPHHHH